MHTYMKLYIILAVTNSNLLYDVYVAILRNDTISYVKVIFVERDNKNASLSLCDINNVYRYNLYLYKITDEGQKNDQNV